jgi:hypothetical protein
LTEFRHYHSVDLFVDKIQRVEFGKRFLPPRCQLCRAIKSLDCCF